MSSLASPGAAPGRGWRARVILSAGLAAGGAVALMGGMVMYLAAEFSGLVPAADRPGFRLVAGGLAGVGLLCGVAVVVLLARPEPAARRARRPSQAHGTSPEWVRSLRPGRDNLGPGPPGP